MQQLIWVINSSSTSKDVNMNCTKTHLFLDVSIEIAKKINSRQLCHCSPVNLVVFICLHVFIYPRFSLSVSLSLSLRSLNIRLLRTLTKTNQSINQDVWASDNVGQLRWTITYHAWPIWLSQCGMLPVIITSGSCSCRFTFAVSLLLMNSCWLSRPPPDAFCYISKCTNNNPVLCITSIHSARSCLPHLHTLWSDYRR